MKIYYRISNNSYNKNRLPNATKEHCLSLFLDKFKRDGVVINIIADNVTDINLSKFIDSKLCENVIRENTSLDNASSFKHCLYRSLDECNKNDLIYFAEDDYLYLDRSYEALVEGLSISNYVTLYDHPDKYINADEGGNPQIDGGGEVTMVFMTENFHWKLTNSTTMTFGVDYKTLSEDKEIWEKHLTTSHPQDYHAFCDIREIKGRTLISSIPGLSTHSEIPWLSPLTDWSKI